MKTLQIRVRTKPLPLSSAGKALLARADSFDWIIFTSAHAAEYFARELKAQKIPLPARPRIAAVGPATAKAARSRGLRVVLVPEDATALGLVRALGNVKGKRVLFPRSALASSDAVRVLRARGARVAAVVMYTAFVPTLPPGAKQGLQKGLWAGISFTSPSGVRGFLAQLSAKERRAALQIPAVCIGPTTARAARAAGFKIARPTGKASVL